MGLDETMYGTVRSIILAQDPLPIMKRVYSNLIQEERMKFIARSRDERRDVMALAARSRTDRTGKTAICSHCKRSGHEPENCFALIDYPEWWGNRLRGDGKGRGRGRGGQVGRRGGRGRGVTRAYAAHARVSAPTCATSAETNATPLPGLTPEQWQMLLHVLNGSKPATTKKMTGKLVPWIIDMGALN